MNRLLKVGHEVLEHYLKTSQPKVCFDLGANEGGYIGTILHGSPNSLVHAFEPCPRVFKVLQEKFAANQQVILNNCLISDTCEIHEGLQIFNCWTPMKRVDALKTDFGLVPGDNQPFDCQSTTLDKYCDDEHINPDFLKVDVDGWEARFLRGAMETLGRCKPLMMMELSYLMNKIGDNHELWVRDLLALGYSFCSMDGSFMTNNLKVILDDYPLTTSFDVMLLPK